MALKRIGVGKRMSAAVINNDMVYLAGFTPDKALGKSVAEQTKDILTQIDATDYGGGGDREAREQAFLRQTPG
jgi:enamine deaminase RidA (YjgF/YER057c/UK114 family)